MFENMRGFVRIEKRKIDPITREIIPGLEPEVIEATNNMMPLLPYYLTINQVFPGLGSRIVLAEKKLDNKGVFFAFDSPWEFSGVIPPGVTSPLFVNAPVGDDYFQIQTKFDPPAINTTRIINRIMVISRARSSDPGYPLASITTLSPCLQQDDELLDIFYKIFIGTPHLTGVGHSAGAYFKGNYAFLKNLFSSNSGPVNIAGFPRRFTYSNFFSKPNGYATASSFINGSTQMTSPDRYLMDFTREQTFTWGSTDNVGDLYGAVIAGNNPTISTNTEFMSVGASKVQSIFGHGAASNVPFADNLNLPLGDATVVPLADSWDETVNFPQMFKIDITASGNATSGTTYKFSVRDHLAFVGNTTVPSRADTWRMLIPAYPAVGINGDSMYSYSVDNGSDGLGGDAPGLFANHGFTYGDYPVGTPLNIGDSKFDRAPSLATYIVKYFNNFALSGDRTGVSIADYLNFNILNIDAAYTPSPLAVTNIGQIAVDPVTTDIYVACRDTGLYRIVFDDVTISAIVTDVTPTIGIPPAGITSAKCFGVDIKDNGDIWAMFDGALGLSANSGGTWTLYDPTTTPKFEFSLTNQGYAMTVDTPAQAEIADWSRCRSLKVHPTDVADKIVIAADGLAWLGWNRAGSTAVSDSFVNLTHTDAASHRQFHANMPNLAMTKYYRWMSDDNVWLCRNIVLASSFGIFRGQSVTILSSSMADVAINVGGEGIWWVGPGIVTERDSADVERILGHSTLGPFAPRWWDIATQSIVDTIDDSTMMDDKPGHLYVYLGKGKFLAWREELMVLSFFSSSSLRATETNSLIWTDYGWNATAWEIGHAGSKSTTGGLEDLVNGVQVTFQNAAGGPHFENTDFYTFSICRGLLKDNSTTLSNTLVYPFLPVERGTELSSNTVPNVNEGVVVDRPVYWGWDGADRVDDFNIDRYAAEFTKPGVAAMNDSVTRVSRFSSGTVDYDLVLVADERISGDFQFKFKMTWGSETDSINYLKIGILRDIDHDSSNFSNATALAWVTVSNATEALTLIDPSGPAGVGSTVTAIIEDDQIEIARVGSVISLFVNASLIGAFSADNVPVALGIFKSNKKSKFMVFDATISYTSNRRVLTMGDSTAQTGGFNPKFLWMPGTRLKDVFVVTINGTKVTVLESDPNAMLYGGGTGPEQGEVRLLWPSGKLEFNPADANKVITASWVSYRDFNP